MNRDRSPAGPFKDPFCVCSLQKAIRCSQPQPCVQTMRGARYVAQSQHTHRPRNVGEPTCCCVLGQLCIRGRTNVERHAVTCAQPPRISGTGPARVHLVQLARQARPSMLVKQHAVCVLDPGRPHMARQQTRAQQQDSPARSSCSLTVLPELVTAARLSPYMGSAMGVSSLRLITCSRGARAAGCCAAVGGAPALQQRQFGTSCSCT